MAQFHMRSPITVQLIIHLHLYDYVLRKSNSIYLARKELHTVYTSFMLSKDAREAGLEVTKVAFIDLHGPKGCIIVLHHHVIHKTYFLVAPIVTQGAGVHFPFPLDVTMHCLHVFHNIISSLVAVLAAYSSAVPK